MATEFFDHYEANGWVQGNRAKPVVNWKAAARNWQRRQKDFKPQNAGWVKP